GSQWCGGWLESHGRGGVRCWVLSRPQPRQRPGHRVRTDRPPPQRTAEPPSPQAAHPGERRSGEGEGTRQKPSRTASARGRGGRGGREEVVGVMGGEAWLWRGGADRFGEEEVEILDLLHVTPKLWQAAHLFNKEGSDEVRQFVRARLLRVLRGKVKGVIKG